MEKEKIWYKPMNRGQWIEVEPPKDDYSPGTYQCPFCGATDEFCRRNLITRRLFYVPYCWACGAYNVNEEECIPDDWMTANEIAVKVLRNIDLDKINTDSLKRLEGK